MSAATLPADLADFVTTRLETAADPAKAGPMAAYMKTSMPFFGVQKPERVRIVREALRRFRPASRRSYEASVRALWSRPHREEKYAAIAVAIGVDELVAPASLGLYERLIRAGAWWDFVDDVAIRLVGRVLREHRESTKPLMEAWIDDDDMWIRRSALISQITHEDDTDHRTLFRHCRRRASETEFFIRKAIGWALRDYSYAAPDRVAAFLIANRERLSGLSFREGAKALRRVGHDL